MAKPSRIFQTLVKLDASTGYPTSEEMHYAYDGSGRLLQTAFAQTPASGFTPSSGASYYDSSHLASSRARAYYVYDAGGRLTQLNHWWDVWGGSAYGTPDALISNTCSYEVTTGTSNLNRGLKTVSDFYTQNSSDHTAFTLDHEVALVPYVAVYGAILAVAIGLIMLTMLAVTAMLKDALDGIVDGIDPDPGKS